MNDIRIAQRPDELAGSAGEGRSARNGRPLHAQMWLAAAATAGVAMTAILSTTSLVHFGYRNVALHVAVELTAALACTVAALLVHGRVRSTLRLRDLMLFASLCGFAATNLLFSTLPTISTLDAERFRMWAPVLGATASTALLAGAAFLPARHIRRPQRAVRRALLLTVAGVIAIAAAVLLLGDRLAAAPTLPPVPGRHARTSEGIVVLQIVSALLFAAAAGGFAVRADRTGDAFARWLAVGATLGAFARLSYALFPALSADWFYAGDVLRLGCFAAVFGGAVQETLRLQRALAASAVVDERRRIARNIHDGVSQDLAFIVQQLRGLARGGDAPPRVERLVHAAERALDESRHAVAALARAADQPLGEVLTAIACEAGEREGVAVETDVAEGVAVPARVQEELVRIVREAVINAARHGRAETIAVRMRDAPRMGITVTDDGLGFDPDRAGRSGLESMRARAAAIGAELVISSTAGRGTTVRITLP